MKTQPSALSGSSIELLEPRIAPASINFTDVDGDMITVTVSGAATTADLDHAVHRAPSGLGFKITGVELTKHGIFQNADLTITADIGGAGDGHVNVSAIDARKLDLHDVTIDGNLGQIDVGDNSTATPALNHLTVESIGALPGMTDDGPTSFINGGVGTIEVHGDVNKVWIRIAAGRKHLADGSIGTILVDGAVIGGKSKHNGSITATGEITNVTVNGDLVGGQGKESGAIGTFGKIGTIAVGDISGGSGKRSGAIVTRGGIDDVTINGSLTGGSGFESGAVGSLLRIQQVTVHGDVMGGAGKRSGEIVSKDSLGGVSLDGNLVGGTQTISGVIGSSGNISSVQIGGGIQGGTQQFTGAILAGRNIGLIAITGTMAADIFTEGKFTTIISARGTISTITAGGLSGVPGNRVLIAATADPSLSSSGGTPAISSLSTGFVEFSTILGGFAFLPGKTYKNPDASIGNVSVTGSWQGSTLAAGALSPDRIFQGLGRSDLERNLVKHAGQENVFSSISSVSISGELLNDPKGGVISGFIAENIISAVCAGTPIGSLVPGPNNDDFAVLNFQDDLVALVKEGQGPSI